MPKNTRRRRPPTTRNHEILDVAMAAEMLTVSRDPVYDLFKRGERPGRKVGCKWLTTRSALLRWIEGSLEQDTLARAIAQGDRQALVAALNPLDAASHQGGEYAPRRVLCSLGRCP